jgi:ABC-type Fe3+/spermidine/putrescine transport system ATPase subunit
MIVLHNAKILANNTPKNLYNNPKDKLIASFFGEFNEINGELVYANQLKVVEKSDLKAIVKQSYYKGFYYLIEADLNGKKVFFEHNQELRIGVLVCLEILK